MRISLLSGCTTMLLASCVTTPQTLEQVGDRGYHSDRKYPMCGSSRSDPFTAHLEKPAVDLGGGIVAQVKESVVESPRSGRRVDVVDCETGVGFIMSGGPQAAARLDFSSDPGFVSELEQKLQQLAADGTKTDVVDAARKAVASGFFAQPYLWWDPSSKISSGDNLDCACDLFYPDQTRSWFDPAKVGPGYDTSQGDSPENLDGLYQRLILARERSRLQQAGG